LSNLPALKECVNEAKHFLQFIHVQRSKSDYLRQDEEVLLNIDLDVSELD